MATDAQQEVALIHDHVQKFKDLGNSVSEGNRGIQQASHSRTHLAENMTETVTLFKT